MTFSTLQTQLPQQQNSQEFSYIPTGTDAAEAAQYQFLKTGQPVEIRDGVDYSDDFAISGLLDGEQNSTVGDSLG